MNQSLDQLIEADKESLAKQIVATLWEHNPEFSTRYGAIEYDKFVQNVKYNLTHLAQALASDSQALFVNYVDWIKVSFTGINISTEELSETLDITLKILQNHYPEASDKLAEFINLGLEHLDNAPSTIPSFLETDTLPPSLIALRQEYLDSLLQGNRRLSSRLILNAVAEGIAVKDIYLHVFQVTLYEIGRLWQMNHISVAQEHYCTAVTQQIMSQLYDYIFNTPRNDRCLVATCIGNELHEIGIRMVADFFELNGWDTYYLGANTPTDSIIQTLNERKADVLAISATMTAHIKVVKELIHEVRLMDADKHIKILVGGYPFNIEPNLWQQVGADGHARNAEQAVIQANMLIGSKL